MTQSNSNEWWFGTLFRIAGYGLLGLSLFDIIDIFVPLGFGNPVWEFQVVRSMAERAPVPLLGLVLVLSSEKSFQIFKFLSWASFVVGLLFLLLIPLGINSSWHINQQNKLQFNQQTVQLQQLKDQLSQAKTAEEINNVLTRLNPQARPKINNPQEVKSRLLSEIAQAETNQANASLLLVKNALKSTLEALVSGVVFLTIWSNNRKVLKVSRQRG